MKVLFVKIGFSEAPGHKNPATFPTLSEANAYLRRLAFGQNPNDGYWKTDFSITFDDGTVYDGRFDIGADAANLEQHCLHFCKKANGDSVFSKFVKEAAKPFFLKMQPIFEDLNWRATLEGCKPVQA